VLSTAAVRFALAVVLAAGAASLGGPGSADGIFGTPPSPTPTPGTIAGRMGQEMSEQAARRGIAFRPFTPPRRILTVALIPPFHGDDTRANRGIVYEYADVWGRRFALAQWPANGGSIRRFPALVPQDADCSEAGSFSGGAQPRGIVWTTARGQIRTLAPDGASDARTLEIEWKKLIRRGACR
jgi:hypothetical protein